MHEIHRKSFTFPSIMYLNGVLPLLIPLFLSALDRVTYVHGQSGGGISKPSKSQDLSNILAQYDEVRRFVTDNPDAWMSHRHLDRNITTSGDCLRDVNFVVKYVLERREWALRFIDSFGKPESGILNGNTVWLGSFDECRAIVSKVGSDAKEFGGKYCLTGFDLTVGASNSSDLESASVQIGLCFPDSCSDADVSGLLSDVVQSLPVENGGSLKLGTVTCQRRSYEYDTKAIVVLSIVGVFGLCVAVGTLYDILQYLRSHRPPTKVVTVTHVSRETPLHETHATQNGGLTHEVKESNVGHDQPKNNGQQPSGPKLWQSVLIAFSIPSNLRKIFVTTQSRDSLNCIHGIRFISTTWLVLGHSYPYMVVILRNLQLLPNVVGQFSFQIITNAGIAVDTFFAMSGLLVCYLFVLNYEKTKQFPVVRYYVHRYWRLTPVYALIMGIYVCLFKYFNTGPLWTPRGAETGNCDNNWWVNMLYLNNLVNTRDECMTWTWYLADDMQFYWISPLILYPLVRKPVIGLAILAVLFVAHIATTAVITSEYKIAPSVLGNGLANAYSSVNDFYGVYYTKPWSRIGPYLIGLACGYTLAKFSKRKVRIRREVVSVVWTAAVVSALAVLFGLYEVNDGTRQLSTATAATWNVLHRNVWALAVCWVIFACVQGYGGIVDVILSWKALIPLSRLTYCCYLIHGPILTAFYFGQTTKVDFSHIQVVYYFCGTLILSYGASLVLCVGCESPLLGLETALLLRISRRQDRSDRTIKSNRNDVIVSRI